ncbi:hypothetical protein [Nonomuraea sp. SYSU D8015]|uniref:hypothetical protein n=1 Tax=Nonomuraea sp. SYSU D8015 TaxID=2593644 RepID=UPI001660C863|nr:hypothetical protein [Nonomuraea sp. SYSU D8015]
MPKITRKVFTATATLPRWLDLENFHVVQANMGRYLYEKAASEGFHNAQGEIFHAPKGDHIHITVTFTGTILEMDDDAGR